MTSQFVIPDILVTWPWPRVMNSMFEDVRDEANAWVKSLELFEPAEFKKFEACNFSKCLLQECIYNKTNAMGPIPRSGLLASFIGPLESREHLRAACDLMNFYFAFDEYTDVADRDQATKIAGDVMETFKTRPASPSTSKITEMARQFFERTISVVGEDTPAIDKFIADFDAYTSAVIQEADDRTGGVVRSVEDYFSLRRNTCGAKPSFTFFALGLNIPAHVFDHPILVALVESAADLISITNDMHSYGLEHARGLAGHNVITSIMYEYNLDLQSALYWLSGYATKTIGKFLGDMKGIPSWDPQVDSSVKEYVDRIGRCVRGYDAWSYETTRYYGDSGLEIQKNRRITLQSPETGYISSKQLGMSLAC